ncbi:AlwI family type II restriction endonuclease [Amphibacillus sp. Q70]|uniref:AlwI family type II restriction endonuclease n=1 Tax=Amphibacillus sp. Q70 TaxID=3453416 RepID=UPI003F84C02C
MKLSGNNSIFNMGDTSFRRKTLLDDYKEILIFLKEHMKSYPEWKSNNEAQGIFYTTVMEHSELFERTTQTDPAQRGRTLTNSVIKPGLINSKRELGEVALNWIAGTTKNADALEKLMSLSIDNLIFLRQWFKLRVYASNGSDYFYPFRIALEFLAKYDDIPEKELLRILHTINPSLVNKKNLNEIIDGYYLVKEGDISFEEYQEIYLPVFDSEEELKRAKILLATNKEISEEIFYELFPNRKSSTSQEDYFYFYKYLLAFKKKKSPENLERLVEFSKNNSIKKAFGFNRIPFNIPRTVKFNVKEFIALNKGNLLLSDDNTKIYTQFILSKKEDLIREYSDMTKRSFNLSGILSFDQGLVNLTQPWLFKKLITKLENNFQLIGSDHYTKYEAEISSLFYKDLTLMEIIEIPYYKVEKIITELQNEFNIKDVTSLIQIVEQEKETRFKQVIEKEFNKNKIMKLLPLFSDRDDKKIQTEVTDSATVPTIFEYIIAIAWYHISDKPYAILKSLNLTLDGNFKPLSHAVGGEGDIVIDYPDLTLMLEATLMNKNSQKRGELEPVIRHAANLTIRKTNQVFTIFIADELDNNVINIFRAMTQVELESTQKAATIESVSIFALSLAELNIVLSRNIKYSKLICILKDEYSNNLDSVKIGWRDKIVEKLLK